MNKTLATIGTIAILAGGVVATQVPIDCGLTAIEKTQSLDTVLSTKTALQKRAIKGCEIAKNNFTSPVVRQNYTIEIMGDIKAIDGGIELFAKAWDKNGNAVGFGKDGTVEIERFIIMNPPILVVDPSGDIVREYQIEKVGSKIPTLYEQRFREDTREALLQRLEHIITLVGKDGSHIEKGKIGNTTSSFSPADGQNEPVDGITRYNNSSFATARSTANGSSVDDTGSTISIATNYLTGGQYYIRRGYFGFDTSSLGSDTIDSAVLTLYGFGKEDGDDESVIIDSVANPDNTAALAVGDYDINNFGGNTFASINFTSYLTSGGANDFTLSEDGKAYIAANVGVFFLATRASGDVNNSAPTGANDVTAYYADQSGTSLDPVLIIEHSGGGGGEERSNSQGYILGI